MAVSASHRTLDVHGVADLQAKLTGKRPDDATIRSYHSRGLMPTQIEPGRWAEKDIRHWLHRRRVRPSPEATRTPLRPTGPRRPTDRDPGRPAHRRGPGRSGPG